MNSGHTSLSLYANSSVIGNQTAAEPIRTYQYQLEVPALQWVKVLVNCPIKWKSDWENNPKEQEKDILDYRIPSHLAIKPGDVVSVPLRNRTVGGIAICLLNHPPEDLDEEKIKDVEDILYKELLSSSYFQLCERIANYYHTDLRLVVKSVLPPGILVNPKTRIRLLEDKMPNGAEEMINDASAQKILKLLQNSKNKDLSTRQLQKQIRELERGLKKLTKRGWIEKYLEPPKQVKPKLEKAVTLAANNLLNDLTPRQAEILQSLKNNGGELWLKDLISLCRTTTTTVKKLAAQGYVTLSEREILRKEQGIAQTADTAKQLNAAQAAALKAISNQTGYAQLLLHGVTGSGKTEVYLQAIACILESGKSALVLVPEIGLTPQLTDRFRARFGERVCVYHSKLSAGERYDTWRQTIQGEPQVVIGTRSAIFAPLPNLGLIVLDEEHDSSFKQDRPVPTYHARTVANWRAELENCPLVLGSATPSLESLIAANQGQKTINHYLSLPDRIGSRPLPEVEIVDLRQELKRGNRSIFSLSLQQAIAEMKEQGQQGILFIPRRGHSTFVSCRSCGYVMECPDCDVSLAYHYAHEGASKLLRCHYCNYTQLQPKQCPECGSPYLKFFGSGTQKVNQELIKLFPDLKPIRFDSDTTRKKGAHRRLIDRFINQEADILIGTQMLTKGLDIAGVTVVGVVAADGLLHRGDYRTAERAFQTLTQVAGRAGRGDEPGKVIIQTYSPEHPVIQAVKYHDYNNFSVAELAAREELNYPPYGSLILLKLSSIDANEVQTAAETLADVCLDNFSDRANILGPAPASIMRVARRYRWQILLKFATADRQYLPDLKSLHQHIPPAVSLTIDVDPLNMD